MNKFWTVSLCFAFVGAAALAQESAPGSNTSQSSVDVNAMDTSVNPCVNFYQYACGNWNKTHPIPPEFARWGRFDELQDRNLQDLRQILENDETHENSSPIDQKAGGFYQACMDESVIEKLGAQPIRPGLDRIAALKDKQELAGEVARLHDQDISVFFRFGAMPDEDNATREIAAADQGGLGLPDKDYYFRKDPKSQQTRDEYVKHISRMFQLLGDTAETADAKAKTVMRIETDLASKSLNRVERRDPQKTHHKMTLSQFEQLFPDFAFTDYLRSLQAPVFTAMNVGEPEFFSNLGALIQKESLDDLKSYMSWHYVSSYAPDLSKPFVDENFAFYSHYLSGVQQIQPRWKRCVRSTDNALGEALGQEYVAKYFAGASKQKTQELVRQIEHEMQVDIESITWMSQATKEQALRKLHAVTNKIGYPEHWRDYSSVKVTPTDYLADVRSAREFEEKRDLRKIGQAVDRSEWGMTPPTVNAYYSPLENNINFPAGILQPPFYSANRDEAVNFGAIGAVIGHELTHGFDDQGRQFDADGNLHDWWTKQDEEAFKQRADCISNEYEGFKPTADVHLNGHLTLGENGADNGGVRLAYMALMGALANHTIPDTKEDGFTPQQRFFLGYAQLWCQNTRPEEALHRAQTDPHSPGQYRVIGVVQNMPEFANAFGCTAGQPMVAQNACRVW